MPVPLTLNSLWKRRLKLGLLLLLRNELLDSTMAAILRSQLELISLLSAESRTVTAIAHSASYEVTLVSSPPESIACPSHLAFTVIEY